MKFVALGVLTLIAQASPAAFAQVPPGHMYGRCSDVYGPVYSSASKAYTASGTCKNGNSINCATDPMDGTPDYYCNVGSNKGQDPNPSVAADEACGCVDN
ncbi:MAG: hypothetical protein U1F66_10915 [bacterium]